MTSLFESEILRFRGLALAAGLVHFSALVMASTGGQLFVPDPAKIAIAQIFYSLLGLVLGLYQLGTHRSLNRWTFLIHRPLPPTRIFLAVSGASCALLALVVGLPLLAMAFLTDGLTSQWVDGRHYLLALFPVGLAWIHYFAGVYIVLSAHRAAVLVLALTSFVLTREVVGLWIFVPLLVVLAWMLYLAHSVFKPDLTTHPRSGWQIAAAALPIQYTFLVVLVFLLNAVYSVSVIVHEAGWKSFAVFSWDHYFPAGTVDHTVYLDDQETLLHGLGASETPRAEHLRGQLRLAETTKLYRRFARFPVRHQLMFGDRRIRLVDEEREIVWTFSHDQLLFHGRRARSGEPVGWMGPGGPVVPDLTAAAEIERFVEVPHLVDAQVIDRRRIYVFDAPSRQIHLRFEAPSGEEIVSEMADHGFQTTVLTSRALYFFDRRDLRWTTGEIEPRARVPLPLAIENLSRIQLAELIDSTVVSFLFGARSSRGFAEAVQIVGELGVDGSFEVVAERPLEQGMPAEYRHRGWMLSPGLQVLADGIRARIAPGSQGSVRFADYRARRLPPEVLRGTVLSMLLAAGALAWATGRREIPRHHRPAWILAGLIFGWPVVLSFFFLSHPRSEPVERARSAAHGIVETPA